LLEFAILGLLQQSPMHGYELRKELAAVLGGLRPISYGSLYPALKRLKAAGLIASDDPTPRALLPADAPALTGRRGKVVYAITAAGKERFAELVSQTGPEAYDDESRFGVHLAFFRHTAADVRLRILEGRRTRLQERLDRVQTQLSRTQQQMDRYATELQRHGVESVEREVRWLSDLINAEHGSTQHERPGRPVRSADLGPATPDP
jgi:DNA-binding PadR family transcriptional regulator